MRDRGSWETRAVSAADAVAGITSGMRVFLHGAAATPTTLVEALAARRDLEGVSLYHLHTAGPAPFVDPEQAGRLRSVSFFAGAPVPARHRRGPRRLHPDLPVADSRAVRATARSRSTPPCSQLSPPDRHGLCTLGTSVDAARAAADHAAPA